MSWIRFLRRGRWDQERARELEAHLASETADNLSRGMSAGEARARALRKLGNPTLIREDIYRMNSIGFVETSWLDLRYACRVLRKSPGFTAVAVLSLALGIGANSAVFSVLNAVLLRPLPYPEPGQLVRVCRQPSGAAISVPEYQFWKQNAVSFVSATAERGTSDRHLVVGAAHEWIRTLTVSTDFFRTLGVAPALGREFTPAEARPGGALAIILTDALWRRAFGADPAVVGRNLVLDEATYQVTGVLPPGFWHSQPADAFVALRPTNSLSDGGQNTNMIARLKPGVGLRQAAAEMPALEEGIRRAYPGSFNAEYHGLMLVPYSSYLVGDIRLKLLLVFGAVALLLLIACSNLAGLLLARLAARQTEVAMRFALGSSRGRLVRQFLAENFLLTLAGGLVGLMTARLSLAAIVASIPFELPASAPVRLDAPVVAFTFAIAFATAIALSLAPILTTSRLDLHSTLKSGGRSGGSARQRTRGVLVVSEIALSVTLLVSAGLLIQSLYRMHREPLGFTAEGLTTFSTPFGAQHRRDATSQWRYQAELLERFQALAGPGKVAAINVLPLNGYSNLPTQRESHPEDSIGGMEVRVVTPSYFQVMRIPVRGRPLLDTDNATSPPVILVNETLARRWWPSSNPLGDRVVIGRFKGRNFGNPTARTVVGVAGDTKAGSLRSATPPTVYITTAQATDAAGSMTWILRTQFSPAVAAELRRTVAQVDPEQRVGKIRTMDEIVAGTTAASRFDASLFAALAGLALLLSAVGIYGLLSFAVSRRSHEIGTRMALGASRSSVLVLVLRQGLTLTMVGLLLGLVAALATTRLLSTLLFGVSSTDPVSFLAVAALLIAVGLLASYIPARRATKVDPMTALRVG